MTILASNQRILARIYFFLGLVLITLSSILLSIAHSSINQDGFLILSGSIGISIGALLVVLGADIIFLRRRGHQHHGNNSSNDKARVITLTAKAAALSAVLVVIVALLLPIIFGAELERIIFGDAAFIFLVLFGLSLVLALLEEFKWAP